MPQLGRIEQWNDDKGYGFVRPLESQAGADAPRAFVHVKAIERAAKDVRIDRIVLRSDHMSGAGLAQLREIGAALRKFRESGKQVVAYGDYYEQKQYYLAAAADEVFTMLKPADLESPAAASASGGTQAASGGSAVIVKEDGATLAGYLAAIQAQIKG